MRRRQATARRLHDPWGMVLLVGDPDTDPVLARFGAALLVRADGTLALGTTIDDVLTSCRDTFASPFLVRLYAERSADAWKESAR